MSVSDQASEASNSSGCPVRVGRPESSRIGGAKKLLGTGMTIERFLPSKHLRMIGAWTFLDHIGPADISESSGVQVGPHPHTGLQTFTWMIEGELLHRDSLGYEQLIRPGQVNLMTAGKGISHSEESPDGRPSAFHGAQLWIALPEEHRFIDPAFEHFPDLPKLQLSGLDITVIAGNAFGLSAPAKFYTPLMAADFFAAQSKLAVLALNPDFEYGVLVLDGRVNVVGENLDTTELLYLSCGRSSLEIIADEGSRFLLIGGTPFKEDVLMWWNFIGRTKEEISGFVADWNSGESKDFGKVVGYPGESLMAPLAPWG
ncbi:pirin family protein [Zhongshania sp. BJYM1]|uniref:pirin family protein n=1 Tax=Zhongshania aquatica TaxID=2965069 RepID=UPI0022B3FD78|nr:pirin family protein [Marortus sp. BJYM1]